jgi:predicted site-specific integrase-resolvase
VVGEYIDHASGKNEERANYRQLLEDARRRRLDVVLVWRYDRFARSTVALVNALAESPTPSIRTISKRLGLAYATTWRYVKELKEA